MNNLEDSMIKTKQLKKIAHNIKNLEELRVNVLCSFVANQIPDIYMNI